MTGLDVTRPIYRQEIGRITISRQELDAVCIAVTPNDFAWLALRMRGHKLQSEHFTDIDLGIRHDLGAARRDVQDDAFALRRSIIDRNPRRLLLHFPSRLARDLCSWLVNAHHEYPSLAITAIGRAIVKVSHQIGRDFVNSC
jgi:hypothetical protein